MSDKDPRLLSAEGLEEHLDYIFKIGYHEVSCNLRDHIQALTEKNEALRFKEAITDTANTFIRAQRDELARLAEATDPCCGVGCEDAVALQKTAGKYTDAG